MRALQWLEWKKSGTTKDVSLSTKCKIINAVAFPITISGCESWKYKERFLWNMDLETASVPTLDSKNNEHEDIRSH